MTNEDFMMTLDSLHQILVDTPQIDAPTAKKLRMLIDDIQNALTNSAPASDLPPSPETLTQRVQMVITDFEVQHPKLTANLSFIAERLADMGI